MFLNFTAVTMLPLADVTAFGFVMPIFAVVLAALVLRERVGRYRWSAVLAGFAGVLVMLSPHGGLSQHPERTAFRWARALRWAAPSSPPWWSS